MDGVFMPELLIPIFIFFLIYNYHSMKKSNKPTEKPTTKAKTEKPAAIVAPEPKPKAKSPTKMPPSKEKAITPKPKAMEKTEQAITEAVSQIIPNKPNPIQKSPLKASVSKALVPEMTVPERVGMTAGDIWHYLNKNGSTAVTKLVRELPEEEKIIQRSIGWLAQEGKITLDTIDRVEFIRLAG